MTKSDIAKLCSFVHLWLLAVTVCLLLRPTSAEAATPSIDVSPEARSAVDAAIGEHFTDAASYRSGDLVSRSDLKGVVNRLKKRDFEVHRMATIAKRIPADSSFLQRELNSSGGRRFMRKLAAIPGGYAKFDQLSQAADGQKTAKQLIRQRGGEKLVAYMASTPGGRTLTRQIPGVRQAHSAKSGPPIYTEQDLADALKSAVQPVESNAAKEPPTAKP